MDDMDIRAGIIQQVIDAIRSRVDEEAAVLVQDVLVMQLPAPNLLVRRMNRQDAAAVLGHTDLRTTQIYCYISLANVKSAYRKYAA